MMISLTTSISHAGIRLDQFLSGNVQGCSRSRAASLISAGQICVNGRQKRVAYRVRPGDIITGEIPEDRRQEIPVPAVISLSVIHDDPHILVLDKPAGLVVHPAPGHREITLVNGLLARDDAFNDPGWPDPLRPGIVHRLDMDTSGVIVVAKDPVSLKFLQNEFKQRRVKKHYLAIVRGEAVPQSGMIDLPIGRHPAKRKLMAVNPDNGKPARTGFRVIQRFKGGALVDVRLYTGRTHQIRVHFYHQGFSLLGDKIYQARRHRKQGGRPPRQMLHSRLLSFRHPYSGRRVEFQAPMPDDFKQVIRELSL